tara:strand:- start:1031 stop:1426 length:396 start_codon:yes stop_codon:yes gene_type:complete
VIPLPRSKPSDCIEYRITLGTKERQQLDSLIVALNFNQITTPVFGLLTSVTGVIALVGLIELLTGFKILRPTSSTIEEVVEDVKVYEASRRVRIREGTESDYDTSLVGSLFSLVNNIVTTIISPPDVEFTP